MERRRKWFLICNSVIPIVIGALIYYFLSPEVLFVERIDEILHLSVRNQMEPTGVWRMIRNYALDMLWAYALVFTLFILLGNSAAMLKRTLLISELFCTAMELLQLTSFMHGTFDCMDIVLEILSVIVAVGIIKCMLFREVSEK